MSMKKTHDHPYSSEAPSAWDPCDEKYDAADRKLRDAREEMSDAVLKCHLATSRRLAAGARLFDLDEDRELYQLAKALQPLRTGDAREALANFLRANPYQSDQSPASQFTYACMSMQDALSYWAEGRYEESHRATVMCRSSLARLGIGRSS